MNPYGMVLRNHTSTWFQQKISPVFVILKCAKQMTHMWTIVRINDAICLRQRQWAKENAKKWKECCCIQYDWLLHLLACNELSTRFYLMFNQHEFDVMWFAANANTPASKQANKHASMHSAWHTRFSHSDERMCNNRANRGLVSVLVQQLKSQPSGQWLIVDAYA